TAGEHARAAELAAAAVAREDLTHTDRVGLAGLAAQSFELSYQAGGALTDLCGLAAVMRLAAPLDTAEGGALKRAEAEKTEARLERAAGTEWRAVCGLTGVASSPVSSASPAGIASSSMSSASPATTGPATRSTAAPEADAPGAASTADVPVASRPPREVNA